ncbi:asparagine synthetase B family protein [Pantanalinema rosaneae CENA516]|uniref:asparagine synthetase B family protein n=1 Tax=Pantanalinema rosaneae TaxID=1620701 RepID=UPI003D6F115D
MRHLPSAPTFSPTWQVAWGQVDHIPDPIWRDQQLAIVVNSSSEIEPPFTISPSQQFVVVGEVWLSQRDRLLSALSDHRLQTDSDLQLIAVAWERWGIATLDYLIGMFGIVVWDRHCQRLWLIRDRVGTRTLYYTTTGATRWIAPQLRSLSTYRSTELDLVALRDYLCCAFVPGERTLWQQVRELRPGTVLRLPDATIEPYWQLQEQIIGEEQPLTWHSDRLRTLLEQVVVEALPFNQPVGVFLSGGLDSSSITALVAKFHSHPVHTYSIHFGAECPNELEFSNLVAQHCQTQHHVLEIPLTELWAQLPETMATLDDPIGDPLTVPNLLLGQLAQASVQVILNGEGGDPCFGGPKNQPMLLNNLYSSVTTGDALSAYLRSFQKCAADLPQLLKPEVWATVQSVPSVFLADLASQMNYLNRLMVLNIKFKGADHILTKVNNLTQAVGLQGRSPLFDARLVELSMQIPPHHKLSGVQEKAVLKQAVIDLLPDRIVHRPKSGMMVPVQFGFRQVWNRSAKALLLDRHAAIAPYLNQTLVRQWLNYQGDPWNRYGVKLWLLASLELWLQGHDR